MRDDELDDEQPDAGPTDPVEPAREQDPRDQDPREQDLGPSGEDEWGDPTYGTAPEAREYALSTPERTAALIGTFVLGLATGLVLVLVWGVLAGEEEPERATSGASLVTQSGSPVEESGSDPEGLDGSTLGSPRAATRLTRCVRAVRALQAPLDAARPAMDQWAVHVGAMNKLVLGEITLEQAAAFWNRTRVGASRNVREFRDAMSSLQRRGVDCPSPELLARGARALPGCARQVDGQVRWLRAARTSVDTWERHIHHMDMLRLGQLSPERATQMWLAMWRRGVSELDAYRLAAREAGRLDGCAAVG